MSLQLYQWLQLNPAGMGAAAFVFRTLRETELRTNVKKLPEDKHTLLELLEKYRDKVSCTKRSETKRSRISAIDTGVDFY